MNKFTTYKIKNLFVTKIIILLFIICTFATESVMANALSLAQQIKEKRVTLSIKEKSLNTILSEIKRQTQIGFVINSKVDQEKLNKLTIIAQNESVENVLTRLLKETGCEYKVSNNDILVVPVEKSTKPTNQKQEKITISGKVLDDTKKPVAGATLIVVGTSIGAITDDKGSFTVTMEKGQSIEISCVGMESIIKVIEASDNNMIIQMKMSSLAVDDVVVTGYFNRKKESYTGATTTFTGKDLRKISTGNLLNSLSMLDPSFTKVTNNQMGSNPNAIPDFEIRGSGSLKSEYEGNPNMPTFILDGFEVTAQKVFDLDPNRVRSMTILKDAAATAIYGSRAANGVVVIETEAPKAGKLQITYNGSVNFEMADLSDYNLMNAAEKLEYERRAGVYSEDGRPSWADTYLDMYNDRMKLVAKGIDTDWIAIPIREMGVGHKHAVMAEGGDESFRYAIDLFYSNKIGVMKGSKRDNVGGSVRLQYNLQKLKFTNYTSFDHVKSVNSPYGDFSPYTYYNPYYYPYNEDGGINKILYEYVIYDDEKKEFKTKKMYNSLHDATINSKDESGSNYFLNNFAIEYDIISGLKLKANVSLSVDDTRTDKFLPSEHTSFMEGNNKDGETTEDDKKGSYRQTFNKGFSYDINAILTYYKQIKRHTLNVGAVYNIRESTNDISNFLAAGFANQMMDHVAMGVGFFDGEKPGGSYNTTRMIGVVGNIGYSFDDKYLLDASVRSDGSSVYGSTNRWGTFWSVGLGWNIAKENFLKDSKAINLLKIRGSIGTTGGQNFYPYQSMAMYSYNDSFISDISYSGYTGAILKALGNNNLKWQKVEKKNIGLDFELVQRRIIGSFNYYNDTSKDVLVDVSIAPSLGFESYMENLGKVKNSGVELTLRGSILRDYNTGLRWDVIFNMVHNKNAVLEINDALTAYNDKQDGKVQNKPSVRYQEGMSINTIWANESLGIDPTTGNEIFLNMRGKKVDKWDVKNYKPLGSTDPDLFGTFGTTFAYKGWEINASFYYKFGGEIYNETLVSKIENVNPNENGDKRILYDRWNKVGDVSKYKKVSDVSVTKPTSRFIEKENMIQLQTVSLSYDFNSENLRKAGIQRLRLSAIGNDLFTASTMRMERGILYPFARTFSVSAQLTF